MDNKVYLVGPITSCSYEGCVGWRDLAKDLLGQKDIVGVSPMRAKEYLENETDIDLSYDTPLSSPRGIMTRDRFDLMTCDVILANFLGAEVVSIGTVMEIAWADLLRKPVILVMEDEGNPHDHPMVTEAAGFRLNDLRKGIDVATAILSY